MNTSKYDFIVSNSEAEALKEMIFSRARAHAQFITESTQENYTSSIKNDVMDLARDSFVSTSKNPFAPKVDSSVEKVNSSIDEKVEETPVIKEKESTQIGFSNLKAEEIRAKITYKTNELANSEIEAGMVSARNSFENKKTFMGALNFLNAQASIVLVKQHGKNFEAVV
jgi:hypothetical protein